jgi:hypothetical protein
MQVEIMILKMTNCGQTSNLHNSEKFKEILEKKLWKNIATKHIEY